jgi:hypothetical protein
VAYLRRSDAVLVVVGVAAGSVAALGIVKAASAVLEAGFPLMPLQDVGETRRSPRRARAHFVFGTGSVRA